MNLAELKQQLDNKVTDKLYLFFGEERYVMDMYINRISKITGLPVKHVDSVSAFINKLNNNNIFGLNYVYVVNDDTNVLTSDKGMEMLRYNTSKHIVILTYNSLDKRTKSYTVNKDIAVEFEKMSDHVIQKHIMKDLGLSESNALRLCKRCNSDYGRIKLCEQKLNILYKLNHKDMNAIYDMAVAENVIPLVVSDVLLDFIDAVMDRDEYGSYFLYSVLKEYGTSELQIIAYLYNSFKNLLLIQSCGRGDNIPNRTGISTYIINQMQGYLGRYYTGRIVKILRRLRYYEFSIKTGVIDIDFVMDSLLLDIFESGD